MPDYDILHSFQHRLDFTTTSSHGRQPYFKMEQYPTKENTLVSLPGTLNPVFHSSQTIKKATLSRMG